MRHCHRRVAGYILKPPRRHVVVVPISSKEKCTMVLRTDYGTQWRHKSVKSELFWPNVAIKNPLVVTKNLDLEGIWFSLSLLRSSWCCADEFRKGWTAKLFSRSWCTNKIKDNQGDPFKLNPLQVSLSLGGSLFNYTIREPSITTWSRRGWEEGTYHVKYSQLPTRGGEGVKIGKNLVDVVIEWTLTVDKRQSQSNLHLTQRKILCFFFQG